MYVSFKLTMPNVGSWNGKWTGAEKQYYEVRNFHAKDANRLLAWIFAETKLPHFRYDFGDGWTAQIVAEVVDAKEASRRKKSSAGFCGYQWMVDSIVKNYKILAN